MIAKKQLKELGIKKETREVLVCPECKKGTLDYLKNKEGLICTRCMWSVMILPDSSTLDPKDPVNY